MNRGMRTIPERNPSIVQESVSDGKTLASMRSMPIDPASRVPESISAKVWLSSGRRISPASTSGARIPAVLLKMPMRLMRRAALSIGPMIVT